MGSEKAARIWPRFQWQRNSAGARNSPGQAQIPTAFNPYEAIWGEAREGVKSYIFATFNFDGLGQSGSFQNVRGLYLIERSTRTTTPFYTSGNIATSTIGRHTGNDVR